MAVGDQGECEERAQAVEQKTHALLDKMLSSLDKASSSKEISQAVAGIAQMGGELGKIGAEGELELNERAVLLDKLEGELALVEGSVNDIALAASVDKLSEKFEAHATILNLAKTELERAKHERGMALQQRLLSAAKKGLDEAEKSYARLEAEVKKPAAPHPLRKKFVLAKKTLAAAWAGIDERGKKLSEERLSFQAAAVRGDIKLFMQRHLEGRIFIDSRHVKLRSPMTGKWREWEMTDACYLALSQMFGESSLSPVLPKILAGKSHMAAKFECRNSAGGLLVELEAGERTTVGDMIIFKPHKLRIMP